MTSRFNRIMGAIALSAAAMVAVPGAAFAGTELNLASAPNITVSYAPECLEAVEAIQGDRELCRVTTGFEVSAERQVSVVDIEQDENLTAADKSSLRIAAAAGTVRSRFYNQWTNGVAYQRSQQGTAYYNGSRVWVTQTYAGKTGSHVCWTSYAVGVTISGQSCTDSGSTTLRTLKNVWSVQTPKIPISYGYSQTMTIDKNGTVSGTNAS